MNETEQETEAAAFLEEMSTVADHRFEMSMSVLQAWALLSCIQLACKHPGMGENLRNEMLDMAHGLADWLPLGPVGRSIADRGFQEIPE